MRIVLVERERDDLGLRNQNSELEAAAGLKIEIMALAALKNMIDLLLYSPSAVTQYGFTETLEAFKSGKIAMGPA